MHFSVQPLCLAKGVRSATAIPPTITAAIPTTAQATPRTLTTPTTPTTPPTTAATAPTDAAMGTTVAMAATGDTETTEAMATDIKDEKISQERKMSGEVDSGTDM